jgi:hypothetical protein
MIARTLLPLAAAAIVGACAVPASAVTTDRCKTAGRQTVAVNRELRVLSRGDTTSVCLRRTGRSTPIFTADGLYTFGGVLALAGHRVGYATQYTPECKADCPPTVSTRYETGVFDAARRVHRVLATEPTNRLVLAPSGTVAWLTGSDADAVLHYADRYGRRTLDTGAIPAASLKRSGTTLRWTHAGAARSATFA